MVGSRPSRRRMSSRSSEITKPCAARDGAAARPLGAPPAVLPRPLTAALPPLRPAAEAGEGVAPAAAAGGTDSARVRRVWVGGWECGPSVPRVARRGGGGALLAEPPLKARPAELLSLRAAELLTLREAEAVAGRAAALRRAMPCAGCRAPGCRAGCGAPGCRTDGCRTDGCRADGCSADGCRADGCRADGCSARPSNSSSSCASAGCSACSAGCSACIAPGCRAPGCSAGCRAAGVLLPPLTAAECGRSRPAWLVRHCLPVAVDADAAE